MIEAAMLWNEPNNKSHWDLELDPDWERFARMTRLAGNAIAAEAPGLPRVLGGISPIDPLFIANLTGKGALQQIDVVAVHGFPLDWNLWMIDEWPAKLAEIATAGGLPVWVSEVGASSFGAEEVQEFGLQRSAELLIGRTPRIHWYSLYDLPKAWPATTRHREAEGSSYYRHFYMGLLREDGSPKRAAARFRGLHAGTWHLPVVSFRRSSAGRRGPMAEAARGSLLAHRAQLGRQFSSKCRGMVRSSNAGARRFRRHGNVLLHARAPRIAAASYEPADCRGGICRILLPHAETVLAGGRRVRPVGLP